MLCIAYKSIFEIMIKQHTISYVLIISKIKQLSGLKNADDFYRLHFCFDQFYKS